MGRVGNINPIPFRYRGLLCNGTEQQYWSKPASGQCQAPRLCSELPDHLGPPDPMAKYCSHGTLLHLGLQGSHLNICYYHQDLHLWRLHPGLRPKLPAHHSDPPTRYNHSMPKLCAVAPCHTWPAWLIVTVRYRSNAPAPSIFRAGWFGRWVVTHSLAVSDFHGHRPAVSINQHLLWYLMSVALGTLTRRLVHPTAPVLLTKNGPLGTHIQGQTPF